MNGLMRMYLAYHGPHSLAPRRAEPMKFVMMLAIFAVGVSAPVTVGRWLWSDADHDVFIFVFFAEDEIRPPGSHHSHRPIRI